MRTISSQVNMRWTKEEETILVLNYKKLSVEELSTVLKRSAGAIHAKVFDLKLKDKISVPIGFTKIPFLDKYYINKAGEVFSLKSGLKIKPKLDKYKYYHLKLSGKFYTVHRLVALTFLENPNNLPQVNHIDGNKQNNNLSNLEWCTIKENNKHKSIMGLSKTKKFLETFQGENNHKAKLTNAQVMEIKKLLNEGIYQKEIAKRFNVCIATIANIKKGKSWSYI